jgi:hypothetical protein
LRWLQRLAAEERHYFGQHGFVVGKNHVASAYVEGEAVYLNRG